MVKYIDKDGNVQEFKGTLMQEDTFKESLEYISGTYFETRELVEVELTETTVETVEAKEEVSELQKYIAILKNAKVKGSHLISDVERAKQKCIDLDLL